METSINQQPAHIARDYVEAVGHQDLARAATLLAPNVVFVGPAVTLSSAAEVLAVLRTLGAVHVRNDIRRVFADGNDVCVIYDFVTDTSMGSVPTVEWMRIEEGHIRSVNVYYDRVPWLALRAARGAG